MVVFAFDGKQVTVEKGKFTPGAIRDLTEILTSSSVGKGEIHLLPNDRVEFEGEIPSTLHQAIRNVIALYLR